MAGKPRAGEAVLWDGPYGPVRADLDLVAARVVSLASTAPRPLREAAAALAGRPGKLIRPALLLLSGLAGPPLPPERAARSRQRRLAAASAFELLHLASLTHDDILDSSPLRRGETSVWGRWGTGMAILTGDHFYGKAVGQASLAGRRATRSLCRAIDALLTGEAIQILAAGRALGRRGYMSLATAKTAVFCRESCGLGAALAGCRAVVIQALRAYGQALGQAYQLTDDILDWRGQPAETGKPRLADLARGRLTFPVIVGLARRPKRVGRAIAAVAPWASRAAGAASTPWAAPTAGAASGAEAAGSRNTPGASDLTDPSLLRLLRDLAGELEACGALDETARHARMLSERAVAHLAVLPAGTPRSNLAALAANLAERKA